MSPLDGLEGHPAWVEASFISTAVHDRARSLDVLAGQLGRATSDAWLDPLSTLKEKTLAETRAAWEKQFAELRAFFEAFP